MQKSSGRIPYLDFIKFIAIASVILGHSVEHISGDGFWDNPVWSFIYTYHMPLFMMLCGYFFSPSLKQPLHRLVMKKAVQLLLPSVTMFAVMFVIVGLLGFNPYPEMLDFSATGFINVLWFLKCVFLCYLIAYGTVKLFRDHLIPAAALSTLALCVVPGGDIVNLNFMLPMFWIGCILNNYGGPVDRHRKPLFAVSALSFAVLLCFWSGRLTVYSVPIAFFDVTSGDFDLYNFVVMVYRLAIGIAGSLTIYLSAPWIYSRLDHTYAGHWMTEAGRCTLGIYVVQTLLLETLIHSFGFTLGITDAILVAVPLAAFELVLCYGAVIVVRKSRVGRLLLFGERTERLSLKTTATV